MLRTLKVTNPKVKCLVTSPIVVSKLKEAEAIYTLEMATNYKLLGVRIMGCNLLFGSDVFTFESAEEGMNFRKWMKLKVDDEGHPPKQVIKMFKRRAKTGIKI